MLIDTPWPKPSSSYVSGSVLAVAIPALRPASRETCQNPRVSAMAGGPNAHAETPVESSDVCDVGGCPEG